MNIQELIQQGRAEMERQARERQAEAVALETERLEELHRQYEAFKADVVTQLPEVLHPYIVYPNASLFNPHSNQHLTINVPGCTDVGVLILSSRPWKWEGSYEVYTYRVEDPTHDPHLHRDHKRFGRTQLSIALATAVDAYVAKLAAEAQIEVLQAEAALEREQREQEQAEERARRADARQAKKDAEEQETRRLIAVLENDPVAAALVRIFIAVQAERDEWEGQMESMSESMSTMESRYTSRLQEARDETRKAQREAEEQQRRTYDAEEKAEKLEREDKRARVW